MIFPRSSCCVRSFTSLLVQITSRNTYASQTASKVNKSALTELRQKTGFSFVQCNNALKACDNNMQEAEAWLREQAEKEGWKKAAKLQTRSTSQGLIGVLAKENYAAVVQVACETDFVARNDLFRQLVCSVAKATIHFRQRVIAQNLAVNSTGSSDIGHLREVLIPHKILSLPIPAGDHNNVEEQVVSVVGKIGENIQVKKALAISTHHNNIIGVASHGGSTATADSCEMGTYGAVVVLKPLHPDPNTGQLTKLARSLSQHVIGMNPKTLHCGDGVSVEESLMGQEFLLDESRCVGDMVNEAGVEVVDFVRFGISDE